MRFQKDVEYGLVTLSALGEGEGLVSASELSRSLGIPRSLEAKILQRLQKGGLIEAVRGQRGGYRLHRPLTAITVQEVMHTLRGSERLAPCLRGEECARIDSCSIRRGVASLQGLFEMLLSSLSVAELAGRPEARASGGVLDSALGPSSGGTEVEAPA